MVRAFDHFSPYHTVMLFPTVTSGHVLMMAFVETRGQSELLAKIQHWIDSDHTCTCMCFMFWHLICSGHHV